MATSVHDGIGWSRESQPDEDGEEDELDVDASPNVGEIRVRRNVDRWDTSPSSKETSEDVGLLEELKDYQINLEEDQRLYDLNELQDLESLGEAEPASPLSECVKDDDNVDFHQGSVSHWHTWRDQQLADQKEQGSFEGQELEEGWDIGSEGEPFPELSCEGLYGSEFSTSPEALKCHLASYKHDKSYNFISDDGEEELSENSHLPSSHSGSPPEHTHFKTAAAGTQGQGGDHQEFLEEGRFSSESERSPENNGFSSQAGSIQWSCSPLGRLSLEDFQNSPSIDSEIFPESSWLEKLDCSEGDGLMMATTNTVQNAPQILAKPKERDLNSGKAVGHPRVLEKVGHHLPQRARKLKADVPHGLPSKFSRQSRSLSPQRTTSRRKARELRSNDVIHKSPSTFLVSDSLPYGRGQLNYPLPDLSKVEPRVRFPKDPPSYHPPRGKILPARSKDPREPIVFKSPAEIVREVLMSSGEGGPPQRHPTAAITVIPKELKSPEQAKELVHQLQEDYHKLLTKYAEAENTIDRLRLKAKGRFYTDPPKPNHGVQMGTVSQATKVMTFSIPQIRATEVTGNRDAASEGIRSQRFSGPHGTSSSLPDPAGTGVSREDGFTSFEKPISGEELTQLLIARANNFRMQVETLEELVQSGKLTPQDQLKVLATLKEGQTALEQAYQQARDEHWQHQKPQAPEGARGDFDPDRAVEGEIFHLEMRLEELKEKIEEATGNQPSAQDVSEPASPPPLPFLAQDPEEQIGSPAPSLQAPIPALCTPYPEDTAPESSRYGDRLDPEASSVISDPVEDGQGLPEPLRHRKHQVEKDFGHLLDHYNNFKSLPASLSLEKLHPDGQKVSAEEAEGTAEEDDERKGDSPQMMPKNKGTRSSSFRAREPQQRDASQRFPIKSQQTLHDASRVPGAQVKELAEKRRNSTSVPKKSSRRHREHLSPQSSVVSEADSAVSECITQTPIQKINTVLSEDLRLISPETDSGFVGSEASRVSPSARTPKHGFDLSRYDASPQCGEFTGHFETDSPIYDVRLRSGSHGMLGKAAAAGEAAPSATQRRVSGTVELPGTDGPQSKTVPEGRARRQHQPKGHSFDTTSQWSDGISSEVEPGRESLHTDSEDEAKIQSHLSAYGPPSEELGPSSSPSATSLSPAQTRRYSLLESRFERNQAIAALQSEVSQLRQSLEEALRGPYSPAKHLSSSSLQMPSRGGARFSGSVKCTRKASGNSTTESELPSPMTAPEGWIKRLSLPHNKTLEDLVPSESDHSSQQAQKEREPKSSASRSKSSKPALLRGPYTGTPYAFPPPEHQEPPATRGSSPSAQYKDLNSRVGKAHTSVTATQQRADRDSQMDSTHTSRLPAQKTTDTKFCVLCKDRGKQCSHIQQAPEFDRGREEPSTCKSSAQEKLNKDAQVQQPGLWYTTVSAPALHYVQTIPLAPYPLPSVIYCPPLATTSTASLAGLPATNQKAWASQQKPQDCHSTLMFDGDGGLRDLNRSLRHAVEAAKEMKLTSKRMSKSLAWELSQAKNLRRSCLF